MDCIVHSLLKKLSAQYRQAQPIFSYLRHFMESNINIDFACGKIPMRTAPTTPLDQGLADGSLATPTEVRTWQYSICGLR